MATGVEAAAAGAAASCCLNLFCKCFDRYLAGASKNVSNMQDAVSQLVAKRSDVQHEVDEAAKRHQESLEEVDNWLRRANDIEQAANKIAGDYAAMCLPRLNCWPRYRIGKRAFRKLQKARQLIEERATFQSLTAGPPANGRQEMQDDTMVVGMDPYLETALRYVDDGAVGIVGICGMGGVGKTTLLRKINNEFLPGKARSKEFDLVLWAVAAKESTVERLQNDIAKELVLQLDELPNDDRSSGSLDQRALPIFDYLSSRSFLLLLDDLWNPLDLKAIGIPHPNGDASGGGDAQMKRKVILTSRLETVCGQMQAGRGIINVQCLEPGDAWRLFEFNVTKQTIASHGAIRGLAEQVATECGGLPLALITIGKALSTKTDPELWSHAIDKLTDARLHEVIGMEEDNAGMLRRLKVSYDYLPTPTIQDCFLSCCLWPEDYSIEKEKLIECWLGLGLIAGSSGIDDDVETGTSIITALKQVRLLESGNDETTEVKMHDMIRELSLWISSECGSTKNKWLVQAGVGMKTTQKVIEQWRQAAPAAERVSLMNNLIEELPPALPARPNLKVLMLQRNTSLQVVPGSFFRSAPALTYLDLSNTTIEELPGEIGSLRGLQYLNLSSSYIKMLPKELASLAQLKHLLLNATNLLAKIPYGIISSLGQLQILDVFESKYASWEVDAVPNGTLPEGEEETGASIEELNSRNVFLKSLGVTINAIAALQKLASCDNVSTRRLCLKRITSSASLRLLPSTLTGLLGSLDMLESLQEFTASSCTSLQQVEVDSGGGGDTGARRGYCIPRLEKLELLSLSRLEAIRFQGMTADEFLPGLRSVKIVSCYRLRNVNWVLQLRMLSHLELQFCSGMESLIDGNDEPADGIAEEESAFPRLKTLTLHGMRSLAGLCRGSSVGFPALEVVEVTQCNQLRRLDIRPQSKLREIRGGEEWWRGLEWEEAGIKESLLPYFKHYVRN